MNNSGFDYSSSVMDRLATGYEGDGTPAPFADLGWVYPAGSMYATTEDLSKFSWALMQAFQGEGPLSSLIGPTEARTLMDPDFYNADGLTLFGKPWCVVDMCERD